METKQVIFNVIDSADLNNTNIIDGQLLIVKDIGAIFLDYEQTRFSIGGLKADSELSTDSKNPIENKTITNMIVDDINVAKAITSQHIPIGALAIKNLIERVERLEN